MSLVVIRIQWSPPGAPAREQAYGPWDTTAPDYWSSVTGFLDRWRDVAARDTPTVTMYLLAAPDDPVPPEPIPT